MCTPDKANTTENVIKKYPYLGTSSNLIEYFIIAGYENSYINDEIIPNILKLPLTTQNKKKNSEQKIFLDYKAKFPTILNSISSDSLNEMMPPEYILQYIFPSPPAIYYSEKDDSPYEPNYTTTIFSNNSVFGDSKNVYHGFGFHFYENPNNKNLNVKVCIPKTFIIVSQYPYFNVFYQLCVQLHKKFFNLYNEIPLEILIYNILNFLPAPINNDYNIIFFPYFNLKEFSSFKTIDEYAKKSNNSKQIVKINQLMGYPVMDIDLNEIFFILPVEKIVEIFILSFLEQKIFFFSKHLEIMNTLMYILSLFSYPFETPYLWQIVSVSEDELKNHDNSTIVGKPQNSMIGVECEYTDEIENYMVDLGSHISMDLENKVIKYKFYDQEELKKFENLKDFIRKSFDYKKTGNFLEKAIFNLHFKLNEYNKKFNNYSKENTDFVSFYKEDFQIISNINLQNVFYNFVIEVGNKFYSYFNIKANLNDNVEKVEKKYEIKFEPDYEKLCPEEKMFFNLFQLTLKAGTFIDFIEKNNAIKLYMVPNMFYEEFIHLKKLGQENKNLFKIIENFYVSENEQQTVKNPVKEHNLNFLEFYKYYKTNLTEFFYYETSNSENIESSLERGSVFFKYKLIEFDKNLLLKYCYILENLDESTKEKIFPSYIIKKNINFQIVEQNDIENNFENYYIKTKELNYIDLIKNIIYYYICITFDKINIEKIHPNLLVLLKEDRYYFIRKHIINFFDSYINVLKNKNALNDPNYSGITSTYLSLFESIKNLEILPTHKLLTLIEQLIEIKFSQENNKANIKITPKKEKNINIINKIENKKLSDLYSIEPEIKKKKTQIEKITNYFDNIIYDGNLGENENIKLHYKSKIISDNIYLDIYSILKLLNETKKLFNEFKKHYDYKQLDQQKLKNNIILLIFYLDNIKINNERVFNEIFSRHFLVFISEKS